MSDGRNLEISKSYKYGRTGFTIVELLIVVVVIAILAAITIVAYNGVRNSSIASILQSELSTAARFLEVERVKASSYPSSESSIPKGDSITYRYDVDNSTNPPTYCLTAIHDGSEDIMYHIDNEGAVKEGACEGHDEGGFDVFNWGMIGSLVYGASDMATSYDGSIVYMAHADNSTRVMPDSFRYIEKSTDGGETWTILEPTRGYYWNKVETSRDGQKILASYSRYEGGGTFNGGVSFSLDGGETWSSHSTFTDMTGCCEVAMSRDSSVMVVSGGNKTYSSNDNGLNWTQVHTRSWQDVSLSEDGQFAYAATACGSSQGFSVSSNYMSSWTGRTVDPKCTTTVATSSSGQYAVSGYFGGTAGWSAFGRTTDGGVTWEVLNIPEGYSYGLSNVRISDTGRITVGSRGATNRLYISKDKGETWDIRSTPDGSTSASRYVKAVALSGNGRVIYATNGGYLYKGTFE